MQHENIYQAAAMCDLTPKEFFAAMIGGKLLVEQPVGVKDSISVFRPHALHPLHFNNMQARLVMGFVKDQISFPVQGVEPPEFYGFVVNERVADVEAAYRAIGSPAVVRYHAKGQTLIACKGINQ